MGKQITFFMTQEDEKDFLEAIRQLGPVKIVHNTFADESKMKIQFLPPVGTSANDANLSLLNIKAGTAIKHNYYPSQGHYCIDLAESEVVQFNRSKPLKRWLVNGRLWFDENCDMGKKSAGFLQWANSLLKWVRKNYQKDSAGHFVGPHALRLAKGGKLQLGPPSEPSLSSEERKRISGLQNGRQTP